MGRGAPAGASAGVVVRPRGAYPLALALGHLAPYTRRLPASGVRRRPARQCPGGFPRLGRVSVKISENNMSRSASLRVPPFRPTGQKIAKARGC
ncbi:protein of unknown function [Paraburkholderia kururiensis]